MYNNNNNNSYTRYRNTRAGETQHDYTAHTYEYIAATVIVDINMTRTQRYMLEHTYIAGLKEK